MLTEVFRTADQKFHWLDVSHPTKAKLDGIAKKYALHPNSIEDCLDPGHQPKFEKIGDVHFLVLRAFDEECSSEADTLQELTRKISIFYKDDYLITVHRKDHRVLQELRNLWVEKSKSLSAEKILPTLLADLILYSVNTYLTPLNDAVQTMDALEAKIFASHGGSARLLSRGYFLKRRAALIKRNQRQTALLVPKVNQFGESCAPLFQDAVETMDRIFYQADDLEEGMGFLLSTHVTIQSQRTNEQSQKTNEVVRMLTVISLFFPPLNFIAGIYGMNFEFMPELKWHYGYPFALFLMFLVSLTIFLWARYRGWLK